VVRKLDDAWRVEIRALVSRTCAEQGVPVWVNDPGVIAKVVTLMGGSGAGGPRKRAEPRRAAAPVPSQSPHRVDSLDLDRSCARGGGADLHVTDDRLDDGALPVEVQR
jgi:hypothetical protein